MFYKSMLICPVIALAACGGSGSSFVTQPLFNAGFAGQDIDVDRIEFTLPKTMRILADGGSNMRFERQDVKVRFSEVAGQELLTLELGGETYTLAEDPNDPTEYNFDQDGQFVETEIFVSADSVVLSELFASLRQDNGDFNLNDAWVIIGRDTDPEQIRDLSGTATYNGVMDATLRRNNYDGAFGDGTFSLTANFSNGSISGTGEFVDRGSANADFAFAPVDVVFENTSIVGNGFSGDLTLTGGFIDGPVTQSGYDGRLFGVNAASVGANAHARVNTTDSDSDTFIVLGFVGDKVPD